MINIKYNTFGTVPNSNRTIVELEAKIYTPNRHIHDPYFPGWVNVLQ
jgi:hypothetical protein